MNHRLNYQPKLERHSSKILHYYYAKLVRLRRTQISAIIRSGDTKFGLEVPVYHKQQQQLPRCYA